MRASSLCRLCSGASMYFGVGTMNFGCGCPAPAFGVVCMSAAAACCSAFASSFCSCIASRYAAEGGPCDCTGIDFAEGLVSWLPKEPVGEVCCC